jgi:hypothetical protein
MDSHSGGRGAYHRRIQCGETTNSIREIYSDDLNHSWGIAAIYWLHDPQRSLRNTRLAVDRYDRGARRRGMEIVYLMAGAMIISAVAVCYLFWRDLMLGV